MISKLLSLTENWNEKYLELKYINTEKLLTSQNRVIQLIFMT